MNIPPRRFQPAEVYYGHWFPRMADNAIIRGQMIDEEGGATASTVKVEIMTKNSNETGDGALVKDSGGTAYKLEFKHSDTSRAVKQVIIISTGATDKGFEELLRYKVSVSGDGWLLGRVFDPVFFDSSKPA